MSDSKKIPDTEMFDLGLKELEKRINNMVFNNTELSDIVMTWFLQMHRTLQQNMIRFLAMCIKKLAQYHVEHPYNRDARNESSVQWLIKVSKIDDEYFPHI